MLKDISLGQFFPGKSVVHRLDPRVKILLTVAFIVVLFIVRSAASFLLVILFLIGIIALSGISFRVVAKGVKPVLPLVLFTAALNVFFIAGTPLWQWRFITITREGVQLAILMSIRIVCLIAGASMLTYTTSPIALTDAIERLFKPLKAIRFPVHEMAMIMTIALRFIPTLVEETDKIMSAQKARGADMESGGLVKRAKALLPILIPLFVSAFRRAEELALAMECRCYQGGEGRTRMKRLHLSRLDGIAAAVVIVMFGGALALNAVLPPLF